MPRYHKFRDIMNTQFDALWNKYILNGHDLIVPSPNKSDLERHHQSFYEQINGDDEHPKYQQVIFHNIGTGIARLPLLYLKYIQYKIDNIAKLSAQHNEGLSPFKNIEIMAMDNNEKKEEKKGKEQEKQQNEKIDFCANDVIEVCVNPSIDVWVEAVFIGYKDKKKCFLEIIKKGKDNHFTEMDVKYIRFKQNDFEQNDEDEKKMEMEVDHDGDHKSMESDEWENVSDFVLKEYIRDVSDELSSNLLNSLDEFMRRMAFLGVFSAKSRSRALSILEAMKNERESKKLAEELYAAEKKKNDEYKGKNDAFLAAEMAQKIADGHTLDEFVCIRCNAKQEYGGIELRAMLSLSEATKY